MDATTFAIGALPSVFDFLGNALETRRQDRMMGQGLDAYGAARREQLGFGERQDAGVLDAFRSVEQRLGGLQGGQEGQLRRDYGALGRGIQGNLSALGMTGQGVGDRMRAGVNREMMQGVNRVREGAEGARDALDRGRLGYLQNRPYTGPDPNAILAMMQGLGG